MAAAFPQFAPGDLLVSLRNMNTIAVLDPRSRKIEVGADRAVRAAARPRLPAQRPHHAVRQSGRRQRRCGCGRSRILEIEPATGAVVWRYDGCGGTPLRQRAPRHAGAAGERQRADRRAAARAGAGSDRTMRNRRSSGSISTSPGSLTASPRSALSPTPRGSGPPTCLPAGTCAHDHRRISNAQVNLCGGLLACAARLVGRPGRRLYRPGRRHHHAGRACGASSWPWRWRWARCCSGRSAFCCASAARPPAPAAAVARDKAT